MGLGRIDLTILILVICTFFLLSSVPGWLYFEPIATSITPNYRILIFKLLKWLHQANFTCLFIFSASIWITPFLRKYIQNAKLYRFATAIGVLLFNYCIQTILVLFPIISWEIMRYNFNQYTTININNNNNNIKLTPSPTLSSFVDPPFFDDEEHPFVKQYK